MSEVFSFEHECSGADMSLRESPSAILDGQYVLLDIDAWDSLCFKI